MARIGWIHWSAIEPKCMCIHWVVDSTTYDQQHNRQNQNRSMIHLWLSYQVEKRTIIIGISLDVYTHFCIKNYNIVHFNKQCHFCVLFQFSIILQVQKIFHATKTVCTNGPLHWKHKCGLQSKPTRPGFYWAYRVKFGGLFWPDALSSYCYAYVRLSSIAGCCRVIENKFVRLSTKTLVHYRSLPIANHLVSVFFVLFFFL